MKTVSKEELRIENLLYARKYRKEHPWIGSYNNSRSRCLNKNDNRYVSYGGRGIKFERIKVLEEALEDLLEATRDAINGDADEYSLSKSVARVEKALEPLPSDLKEKI